MKPHLPLCCLLILVSYGLSGQGNSESVKNKNLRLGAKFIADISNNYKLSPEHVVVVSSGVQLVKGIKQSLISLETGFYFLTKGIHHDFNFPGVKLGYLCLPLNFRIDTKTFYISTGPYVDALVSRRYEKDGYRAYDPLEYRTFNLGMNFALGIEKKFSDRGGVFMEFRTFNNVTSITKNARNKFINLGMSNNGIAVGMNYVVK